ncbi:hypothetical protein Pan258_60630 [Symmachiella dynata]|uniref:hypothetical protein n=1 Tax=Symmachiella dynata TaxID=2527995 RepID=UPI00118C438D|nr:hypothetical protein [Symmachiella dynata]QDT51966.1 hypothetical protein Pan258_60630 [Symmachiella dynata]
MLREFQPFLRWVPRSVISSLMFWCVVSSTLQGEYLFAGEDEASDLCKRVLYVKSNIELSNEVKQYYVRQTKDLLEKNWEIRKVSGGIDPRRWTVFLTDTTLILVSRQEFPFEKGANPLLKVHRAICKSHVPGEGLCSIERTNANDIGLENDPILSGQQALFRQMKCRVILTFSLDDDLKTATPTLDFLVSHARVVNFDND